MNSGHLLSGQKFTIIGIDKNLFEFVIKIDLLLTKYDDLSAINSLLILLNLNELLVFS